MSGVNDLSSFASQGIQLGGVQENALGSWGGHAGAGNGGYGSWGGGFGNQQGQGQEGGQNAYPDWRRRFSMMRQNGLSQPMGNTQASLRAVAPMTGEGDQRPAPTPYNAPAPAVQQTLQAVDPKAAMNWTSQAAAPTAAQQNALWNSGGKSGTGGWLR